MRLFSSILFLFLSLLSVKAQQISYLCSDTLVASITATCTDGTGPYTYEWENPSGDVVSSDEIDVTEAGIYAWRCEDSYGCTKTGTHQIIIESTPTISINSTNTCVSVTQVLTVTGVPAGYTYSWDLDGGTPSTSTSSNPSVFWATSGTKNITLTISKVVTGGCSSVCSVEVSETITIGGPVGDIGCSVGVDTCYTTVCDSALLTSSFNPAFTHSWVSSLGQTSSLVNPTFFLAGDEETFVLTVTDEGCTATRTIVVVNCPAECELLANIEITGETLLAALNNCQGEPSYQWQKYNTGTSTWEDVGTDSPEYSTGGVSAMYKVIVDCGFGCTDEATIDFVYCALDVVYVAFGLEHYVTTTGCTGPRTYNMQKETTLGAGDWTTVETSTTSFNSYFYFAPSLGSYRVVVTCGSCTRIAYSNQGECTNFSASTTVPTAGCTGVTTTFSSTHSGGAAPVTVLWFINSSPIAGPSHVFTSPGVYAVQTRFTDDNDCEIYLIKTISITTCCVASNTVSPTSSTICEGGVRVFTTTATSGTGPYTYQWYYKLSSSSVWIAATTGTTYNFSQPTAGTYNVKAVMTTSTGCISEAIATITVTTCTDCECTPSIAIVGCTLNVTFTGSGCSGATYNIQLWNGTTWLSMASVPVANFSYTPVTNGLYRIRRVISGCADVFSNVVSVSCVGDACSNPATISLAPNQSSCTLNPVIFTGNSIGGGATTATVSHTGLGVATITWIDATNFNITYTPALGDAGIAVTLTVTTNSLPSPCTPTSATVVVIYVPTPDVDITSSIADLCLFGSRTITATPVGGTFSVTGSGSMAGNILTATSAGNITVTYSYVLSGCTTAVSQIIRSIQCTPTLTLAGCTLNSTSSGFGCSTYTYDLQYSTTGTGGWTTVQTGTSGSFSHTPSANGYYRVVNVHPVCSDLISNVVNVTCLSECVCSPSISLVSCTITWAPCSMYATQLQRLISGTWTNITGTSPYTPTVDGSYRVVYTKAGCPTLTSSTVVHNNICESEYAFTEEGVDYYTPFCYYFPDANYAATGTVNRKVNFYANTCGSAYLGEYLFNWGDGSTRTGIADDIAPHTYASNGERTVTYSRTINSNSLMQNIWVNANTTEPNIPRAYIEPNCADGSLPIYYTYNATCNTVNVFVNFKFSTRNYTPTYGSHFVKINGTTYTVPITFTTTGTNTTWYISSAVGIPLTVSSSVYSVEASLTFDGKTVTNKGYFYICNSTCVEDNCNDTEYTFQVDPVSPAPISYIFDRDISTDPWLEDATAACAPYDTYIMGGTSNIWDFTVTSSSAITWSYTHYEPSLAINLTEVSRTATSIRFRLLGASTTCGCGAAPPVSPVCGVTIVNAMMRLVGRDACNNVVFDRIFLKYNNN